MYGEILIKFTVLHFFFGGWGVCICTLYKQHTFVPDPNINNDSDSDGSQSIKPITFFFNFYVA